MYLVNMHQVRRIVRESFYFDPRCRLIRDPGQRSWILPDLVQEIQVNVAQVVTQNPRPNFYQHPQKTRREEQILRRKRKIKEGTRRKKKQKNNKRRKRILPERFVLTSFASSAHNVYGRGGVRGRDLIIFSISILEFERFIGKENIREDLRNHWNHS